MNSETAQKIIQNSTEYVDISDNYVRLDGKFTVEDLHAILQLMEYDA